MAREQLRNFVNGKHAPAPRQEERARAREPAGYSRWVDVPSATAALSAFTSASIQLW
jgi:hypothetical protein